MKNPIVRVHAWMKRHEWADILRSIAKGDRVFVWHGYMREVPYPDGKCALRVRVGKKTKLVRGRIELESDGWDDLGDYYSLYFYPNKPRVLTKRLYAWMYE